MLVEVGRQNNVKVAEVEAAAKKRYEELRSEYRLLQASFKNFRSHLQDEMNGQWNFKVNYRLYAAVGRLGSIPGRVKLKT